MIVISDTSSLYYAAKIGCDNLFPQVFGEAFIPEAVRNELLANQPAGFIDRLLSDTWLNVRPVSHTPLLASLLLRLDKGEAEAIALATELSATYVLIDERRGKTIAKELRLNVVGLLGFFLLAKQKGLVQKIKPLIDSLITQTGFRHSKELIAAVLALANE